MSENTAHYIQRSPRYILLPQDNCFIRVAGPQQTPWEEGTEVRNVSNTGLSFTAPSILTPVVGEMIRVQFHVPGSQQMACHARVVRVEEMNPNDSLVGIEFESLNEAQQWNLMRGLVKKRVSENDNVIDLYAQTSLPSSPFVKLLFFLSVGLSLFFSAFLLFFMFRFLVDPTGMEGLFLFIKNIFIKSSGGRLGL